MSNSVYNFIRFNHTSVEEVKEYTPKQVAIIVDRHNNGNGNVPRVKTKEFDGIPIENGLFDFCTHIRRAFPTIKFGMNRRGGITYAGETHANRLFMYYDEDEFAIGYVTIKLNYKGQTTFNVCTPRVDNGRYSGGEERYTVGSSDVGKAIKLIKKYARRYTPRDIALMNFTDFESNVQRQRNKANGDVSRAKQSLTYNDELLSELLHLHRSGYKFVSDRFSDTLNTLVTAMEEDRKAKAAPVHAWHINIREEQGEQTWIILNVANAHDMNENSLNGTPILYKAGEVPEDIMGKVASLSLVEVGHFVDGLGERFSNASYWVIQ